MIEFVIWVVSLAIWFGLIGVAFWLGRYCGRLDFSGGLLDLVADRQDAICPTDILDFLKKRI